VLHESNSIAFLQHLDCFLLLFISVLILNPLISILQVITIIIIVVVVFEPVKATSPFFHAFHLSLQQMIYLSSIKFTFLRSAHDGNTLVCEVVLQLLFLPVL